MSDYVKNMRNLILVFLLGMISVSLQAQQSSQAKNITVTGTVVDINDEPLIGATVMVLNTKIATSTGVDGEFTITFPEKEKTVLSFSLLGMKTKEIPHKKAFFPEDIQCHPYQT